MGALAGHMSHLYGDTALKIRELTSIIKKVGSGDLNYNEKADGQNVFVTMDSQRNVLFARNQAHRSQLGITADQLADNYLDKNQLEQAEIFGAGCKAIEYSLQSLSNETFESIFADPNMPLTYINCEIIHERHFNMVLYEKCHIQFHELKVEGDAKYDNLISGLNILSEKFKKLLLETAGQEVTYVGKRGNNANQKMVFTIDGPKFLKPVNQDLSPEDLEIFNSEVSQAVQNIEALVNISGVSLESTVGDYLVSKIEDEVLTEFNIPKSIISDISNYLVYRTDSNGINIRSKRSSDSGGVETLKPFKQKLIAAGLTKEMTDKFTLGKFKSFQNGLVGAAISPLKDIIHQFSLSILNRASSVIASDPELAKFAAKAALSDIPALRRAVEVEFESNPERLEKNLSKFNRELELLGDINKFSQSMEGVVISYVREDGMPVLYKLTGNFAPANQLLGMTSQGFKIKRNLLNKAKQEYAQIKHIPEPEDPSLLEENRLRKIIRQTINKVYMSMIPRYK